MNKKILSGVTVLIFYSFTMQAQVQVSKEPRHNKVLENKYIRLLDVRILPGDTTLFHIHAIPSLFLEFTSTDVCVQEKGKAWAKNKNQEGDASYRSFIKDTLIHRVSNCDTIPFHVNDIEILASYKPTIPLKPLPFTVLFENEKVFAYRLSGTSFKKQMITGRGPIVAELVAGQEVIYHETINKKSTKIKTGKYLYIKPRSSFYFSAKQDEVINMVVFEIK